MTASTIQQRGVRALGGILKAVHTPTLYFTISGLVLLLQCICNWHLVAPGGQLISLAARVCKQL